MITHYHRRDRPPFRNLSDLPAPDLEKVLRALAEQGRPHSWPIIGRPMTLPRDHVAAARAPDR